MNAPTQQERIAFWMHSYARSSFIQARSYAQIIMDDNPTMRSSIRRALSDAILGAYCRPFKQRSQVRLPEVLVPASHRDFHDAMIKLRDKVVAHRDLDGPITDWGFISQLQLNYHAGQLEVQTISPTITNENSMKIIELTSLYIAAMDTKIDDFVGAYIRVPFRDESYVVSLDKSPEHWLVLNPNGDQTA